MAQPMPHVEHATLTEGPPGVERTIGVGTRAWFTWLETATAFLFSCPEGTFTARRERASTGRGHTGAAGGAQNREPAPCAFTRRRVFRRRTRAGSRPARLTKV